MKGITITQETEIKDFTFEGKREFVFQVSFINRDVYDGRVFAENEETATEIIREQFKQVLDQDFRIDVLEDQGELSEEQLDFLNVLKDEHKQKLN